MQYPDSVEFLYALGNEIKTAKFGLDRIRLLLRALGDPQREFQVVHVAGTNGKGSTCAMIAAGLQAAGRRTGLFTSPHLIEPTERIRIDGADLSRAAFVEVFREVHEKAEAMVARGELDLHPTYFETVTAMGFLAFARARVDWAVVEVGLGGRLDATNVLASALSVVTPIDYDHEAILGNSIEAIAAEKAGILKAGVPALFSTQRAEALAVLEAKAREVGAETFRSEQWAISELETNLDGARFTLQRPRSLDIKDRLQIECPLRGAWQVENARVAAAALDLLQLDASAIEEGIRNVHWPGRLERVATHPEIFVDGAHNPAGCAALAEYIRASKGAHRTWLVFGAMRDKAISEMAALLFSLADELVLTAPPQARALRPEVLAAEAEQLTNPPSRIHIAHTFPEVVAVLRGAQPEDRVFIAGSLYLAGEAKAWFTAQEALRAS
ncbi:MAG: bifunctional folylpolyglutamate synthase/dihydrofolate synthase [Bryobacterales bacterium]|nr:bifunctional folylpolyglutamate synthase/dihydrofolate synthase [Bryobacterales bacterium]